MLSCSAVKECSRGLVDTVIGIRKLLCFCNKAEEGFHLKTFICSKSDSPHTFSTCDHNLTNVAPIMNDKLQPVVVFIFHQAVNYDAQIQHGYSAQFTHKIMCPMTQFELFSTETLPVLKYSGVIGDEM